MQMSALPSKAWTANVPPSLLEYIKIVDTTLGGLIIWNGGVHIDQRTRYINISAGTSGIKVRFAVYTSDIIPPLMQTGFTDCASDADEVSCSRLREILEAPKK